MTSLLLRVLSLSCALAVWPVAAALGPERPPGTPDLTELSLEELAELEVTTVSRKRERFVDTASAVSVITSEDIARSRATALPELLRLVPGVQVARITSNQWAIGVRGFASRLARSVLVQIDGRSVYTPLFAGTYWEVQDLPLELVERIEVVRGPGGALWDANAFNGVINIITKRADETLGTRVAALAGTEERGLVEARHGGRTGERTSWRVWTKLFDRDGGFHAMGEEFDDWRAARVGLRIDHRRPNDDRLSLSGDLYTGDFGKRTTFATYEPRSRARSSSRRMPPEASCSGAGFATAVTSRPRCRPTSIARCATRRTSSSGARRST
jgi:iron complex outermembrane receptor protein